MKIRIEDTGRNGETEIAVIRGDDVKIYPYGPKDLTNGERLNAAFWKRNGYIGRLEITDGDLDDAKYVVNVR